MATLFEKHQELLDILSSKRKVRDFFSSLHNEDIEKMIKRQNDVYQERLEEEEKKRQEEEAKKMLIEEAKEKLAELGLTVEDLVGNTELTASSEPKQRRTRKSPDKVHFLFINKNVDVEHLHRPNSGRFPEEFNAYVEENNLDRKDLIFTEEQVEHALRVNKLPTDELESRIEEEVDVDDPNESFGNK